MKFSMKVEGGQALAAALNSLSTRISKPIARDALEFGAEPIRLDAGIRAPRRAPQPDIADHIVIATARAQDGDTAAVAVGPAKGLYYYGFFQEYGTSHHGAQPFMRPAFESQAAKALQRITQELWRALAARGVSRSVSSNTPVSAPDGGDLI